MKSTLPIYLYLISQIFIGSSGFAQTTVLSFGCLSYENGKYTAEIIYENNSGSLLAGWQFDVNVKLDSANGIYGGNTALYNWAIVYWNTLDSSTALAASLGQPYIPADTSVLTNIVFTNPNNFSEVCLIKDSTIMADPNANAIPVIAGPCLPLINFEGYHDTLICNNDLIQLGCSFCDSFPGIYYWTPTEGVYYPEQKNPFYEARNGDALIVLNIINECDDTFYVDSTQINVINPEIDIVPGTEICVGTQVHISSSSSQHGEGFYWENDPLLNFSNLYTASAILDNDHVFYLSSDLCSKIDSIAFQVSDCSENVLFIPSAFSPNNDNINDLFIVRGKNIESLTLSIYNRYGEVVFNTNNPNEVWDGTFNGSSLSSDVFIYKADVIFLDKESKQFSGNLSLIK